MTSVVAPGLWSVFLLRLSRLTAYIALTVAMMPAQAFALWVSPAGLATRLPGLYHRIAVSILGIKVDVSGVRSDRRPTLYLVNHISYLDIEVLSSILIASFIAKAEISRWPFFGWLAKLQRTVFIDRKARSLSEQRETISRRLLTGDDLILFPEGTSGDGNRVLPFKSALLSIAELSIDGTPLTVQPVSLAYTSLNGIPVGRDWRPHFAWYGDMELVPHLWEMLGFGRLSARVHFHAPVRLSDFASRKALSEHCRSVIAAGVSAANTGRPLIEPKLPEVKSDESRRQGAAVPASTPISLPSAGGTDPAQVLAAHG